MKFDVITLFPKMFEGPFGESIVNRAIKKGIVELKLHDMRQWAWNSYGAVDDRPYGGGVGMLIRVDVIDKALKFVKSLNANNKKTRTILLSAGGKRLTQEKVEELAKLENIVLICGHYEGFDQRVADFLVDEELSIGEYVLSGGELAAMVVIDSVARLQPGVLGKDESSQKESFSEIEIESKKVRVEEYPQYTRPVEFEGHLVPKVLKSGDPKKIKEWQIEQISQKFKDRN